MTITIVRLESIPNWKFAQGAFLLLSDLRMKSTAISPVSKIKIDYLPEVNDLQIEATNN